MDPSIMKLLEEDEVPSISLPQISWPLYIIVELLLLFSNNNNYYSLVMGLGRNNAFWC